MLYLFAIMPPEKLSKEIHDERLTFAEEYGFVAALKSPVHITLFPPFKIPVAENTAFESHVSNMQNWADSQHSLTIELQNFNFFDNYGYPVLFIDVLKSPELVKLRSSFLKELDNYPWIEKSTLPFKPHITIGYRDIDQAVFPTIREVYARRKFKAQFDCNAIYLWKHDGKQWQVFKTFCLNGQEEQEEQLSLF